MTEPGPDDKMVNVSPYGTWRSSPKGLAGRDPIFFAQLASETETFHPESPRRSRTPASAATVQGQRQFAIDRTPTTGTCEPFVRDDLDADPVPGRRTIRCGARALCRAGARRRLLHHLPQHGARQGRTRAAAATQPQNACIAARQERTNPGLHRVGRTFTGNFLLGPPGKLYGPFHEPKKKPMTNATGMMPEHSEHVKSSEMCASCHTVHLPVLHRGKTVAHTYEQATYPEWAFSAYRTGTTADGPLPLGAGAQGAIVPGLPHAEPGRVRQSRTAARSRPSRNTRTFRRPSTRCRREDIDLPVRDGFGQHTLVGLNVFLIKMAQQFPDILGIRTDDPMLTASAASISDHDRRERDARPGGEPHRRRHRRRGAARPQHAQRQGDRRPTRPGTSSPPASASAALSSSSACSTRATRCCGRPGAPMAPASSSTSNGTPDRGRAVVEAGLLGAHRSGGADASAALPGDHAAGSGADLRGAGREAAERRRRRSAAPARSREGQLTTSFLSICAKVKDNRLLPAGFLAARRAHQIAQALGADDELAEEAGAGRGRRRSGLSRPAARDTLDLPRAAVRQLPARAGRRAGDALLPGDAAVLSAGSLLHLAQRRTPRGSIISRASSTSPARRRRTGSCGSSPAGR